MTEKQIASHAHFFEQAFHLDDGEILVRRAAKYLPDEAAACGLILKIIDEAWQRYGLTVTPKEIAMIEDRVRIMNGGTY